MSSAPHRIFVPVSEVSSAQSKSVQKVKIRNTDTRIPSVAQCPETKVSSAQSKSVQKVKIRNTDTRIPSVAQCPETICTKQQSVVAQSTTLCCVQPHTVIRCECQVHHSFTFIRCTQETSNHTLLPVRVSGPPLCYQVYTGNE